MSELGSAQPWLVVCEPYKHFPQLMALEAFKKSVITLPSSALAPASAWAELVLFPDNPGRPADRPTADGRPSGIVLFSANTAWRSKEKLLVYMNKPQQTFQTLHQPQK